MFATEPFTASADYETPVNDTLGVFVGSNLTYQSKTTSLFYAPDILATSAISPVLRPGVLQNPDYYKVKAFTTVDARIGVQDLGGSWKAWIWGRNIFNTYYWNNSTQSLDSIYRLASMPATYGAAVSFRF